VLAGHSQLDVTQRYAHATAEDLRAAIAKLSD
jgi:site-specific recombinase XerD